MAQKKSSMMRGARGFSVNWSSILASLSLRQPGLAYGLQTSRTLKISWTYVGKRKLLVQREFSWSVLTRSLECLPSVWLTPSHVPIISLLRMCRAAKRSQRLPCPNSRTCYTAASFPTTVASLITHIYFELGLCKAKTGRIGNNR